MADESPKVPDIVEARYGIDEEITERIKKQAAGFIGLFQRTVAEAWEIGKELTEAKSLVARGYWIPWVETEVGLSRRTAQRLMAVYERDPESVTCRVSRAPRRLCGPYRQSNPRARMDAPVPAAARKPRGRPRERSPVRVARIWTRASNGLNRS